MAKKPEPHNEKKHSLKPLTTRQALKKAMQAGNAKRKPTPGRPNSDASNC